MSDQIDQNMGVSLALTAKALEKADVKRKKNEDQARVDAALQKVSEGAQEFNQAIYRSANAYRKELVKFEKSFYDTIIPALAQAGEDMSPGSYEEAKRYWLSFSADGIDWAPLSAVTIGNIKGLPEWYKGTWNSEYIQKIIFGSNINEDWRKNTFSYSLKILSQDRQDGTGAPPFRPPVVKMRLPPSSIVDTGYPNLWVYWTHMMLKASMTLLEQHPYSSLASVDTTFGWSWAQDYVDNMAATGMATNAAGSALGICTLNHQYQKGILGMPGGDSIPEENCGRFEPGDQTWTAWTAYYHPFTGIDGNAIPEDCNNTYAGMAFRSVNSILRSGGVFQATPEIGTNALNGPLPGNAGCLGRKYGYTSYVETDSVFGPYRTSKNGCWSLRSIAKRVQDAAREFAGQGYLGDWTNVLGGAASIVQSHADRLQVHSDAIVAAHKKYIKLICEQKEEIDDIGGHDDNLFDNIMESGDEYEADLAQQQLETASIAGDFGTTVDARLALFRHQCFLLSFVQSLSVYKRDFVDQRYTEEADKGSQSYKKINKRLPYVAIPGVSKNENLEQNACVMLDGDPYAFMNALTTNPDLKFLHNAMPHELSSIQPYIRLYKVIFDDEGNEQEVEITFNTHFSQDEMLQFRNAKNRGVGAGLKSFNFTYDGSNPFAVKKSIKANLKIFANSFKELHRTRGSSFGKYSYLDLAMKTWNTADDQKPPRSSDGCHPKLSLLEENVINSELNFRLKAVVGLSVPPGNPNSISENVKRGLRESYVTLNLTPTVHNFEFDEMGRVTFNLNFLAYVEQFFDTNTFNVFSQVDVTKRRLTREFKIKEYQRTCDREQVDVIKEEYATEVSKEIETALSSLLEDMMADELIYSINIENNTLAEFLMRGPYGDYGGQFKNFTFGRAGSPTAFEMQGIIPSVNSASQNAHLQGELDSAMSTAGAAYSDENLGSESDDLDERRSQVAAALFVGDPNYTTIEYFYLSDLIDKILERIGNELKELGQDGALDELIGLDNVIQCQDVAAKASQYKKAAQAFKKMRVLLGPVEFANPNYDESNPHVVVNLGDIPISIKYFAEWLTNVMFKKEEIYYPLTRFLNDLINGLVRDFLNDSSCFGYNIKQKARLQQATVSGFSPTLQNEEGEEVQYDVITSRLMETKGTARYTPVKVDAQGPPLNSADQLAAAIALDNQDPSSFPPAVRAHLDDFPRRDAAGRTNRPILKTSGEPGSARVTAPLSQMYNYLVYFVGRVMPNERMTGDKEKDEQAGIFHYTLGRDRGTLKNIKLTKTQTKGLAEVRFEQDGYDGLQQLRVIYDAQVDMFSNVQAYPGQYIFIDPRGFAPDMPLGLGKDDFGLTKLGVGGYYMIVRSEHEFGPGYANSILHTKWVNQIDSDADNQANSDESLAFSSSGDGSVAPRQCMLPEATEDVEGG